MSIKGAIQQGVIVSLSVLLVIVLSDKCYANETLIYRIEQAYEEVVQKNDNWGEYDISDINKQVWEEKRVLALVEKDGLASIVQNNGALNNYKDGEWRYLGKTPDNILVNNPDYPDDYRPSVTINGYNRNWLMNKDKKTRLKRYITTPEDRQWYIDEIKHDFNRQYGSLFDPAFDDQKLLETAVVVVPPTYTGRGILRFYHQTLDMDGDGVKDKLYYTVNMRSEEEARMLMGLFPPTAESKQVVPLPTIEAIPDQEGAYLRSNKKGEEVYDTNQGIPSSSPVYANVMAGLYQASYSSQMVTGSSQVTVTVKGTYIHEDGRVEPFSDPVSVTKAYAYQDISDVSIASLSSAKLTCPALEEPVHIEVSQPVHVTYSTSPGKILSRPRGGTLDLGTIPAGTDVSSPARSYARGYVTQDASLTLNGQTIQAGDPLPPVPLSDETLLYKEGLTLRPDAANAVQVPVTATAYYEGVTQPGRQSQLISGRPIRLHTPVVSQVHLSDHRPYYQGVKDPVHTPVVLEEVLEVTYPTQGQHLTIPGYGLRDYRPFIKDRQVRFSFDVFKGQTDGGQYCPGGQWISMEEGLVQDFFIPPWVEETEEASLSYRTIPINGQGASPSQPGANTDITKYVASGDRPLQVVGQIKEVALLDQTDQGEVTTQAPPWAPRQVVNPVSQEEITLGCRLGYDLKVAITTNGDMHDKFDYLRVQPRYYYEDKASGNRQEVDLYYGDYDRIFQLNAPAYDEVIIQEGNLSEFKAFYDLALVEETAGILAGQDRDNGYSQTDYQEALMTPRPLQYGDFNSLQIDERHKLYTGETSQDLPVADDRIQAAKQTWYMDFFLPGETYAVPKGSDLTQLGSFHLQDPPFLHDGYILVTWSIYAVKGGEDYLVLDQEPMIYYDTDYKASQLYK